MSRTGVDRQAGRQAFTAFTAFSGVGRQGWKSTSGIGALAAWLDPSRRMINPVLKMSKWILGLINFILFFVEFLSRGTVKTASFTKASKESRTASSTLRYIRITRLFWQKLSFALLLSSLFTPKSARFLFFVPTLGHYAFSILSLHLQALKDSFMCKTNATIGSAKGNIDDSSASCGNGKPEYYSIGERTASLSILQMGR